MTELAATIGTGNIVGVATAMVLGGPGALVWMLLSALVGFSTKLAESLLAVKYRTVNDRGGISGGPMYTMLYGFTNRKLGRVCGTLFALFAVFASFGMGNMTQANSISSAMNETFGISGAYRTGGDYSGNSGDFRRNQNHSKGYTGCGSLYGNFYLAGAFLVILVNFKESAGRDTGDHQNGIFAKSSGRRCRWYDCGIYGSGHALGRIQRVFPMKPVWVQQESARRQQNTDDPVRQGYISMTGVFFDTIVICVVTGLALAASGVLGITDGAGEPITGSALTIAAFFDHIRKMGWISCQHWYRIICICNNYRMGVSGEKAFEFLVKKSDYCIIYRFVYALTAFLGATCALDVVWDFSDIMNALMAVPNLFTVLLMSKDGLCGGVPLSEYHRSQDRPFSRQRSSDKMISGSKGHAFHTCMKCTAICRYHGIKKYKRGRRQREVLSGTIGGNYRIYLSECISGLFGGIDKYFIPFIQPKQQGNFSTRK